MKDRIGSREIDQVIRVRKNRSELVALRWDDINLRRPESCTCAAPRAGKQASTR